MSKMTWRRCGGIGVNSFVDAYLCALNLKEKNDKIVSFDREVGKVKGVDVKVP